MGGDGVYRQQNLPFDDFNPHLRMGGDEFKTEDEVSTIEFQSTPPYGR